MINFFSENDFDLENWAQRVWNLWLEKVIRSEGYSAGVINYIFCSDEYLHKINVKFLNHDDYTDIITFDNTLERELNAEIFLSTERVVENANKLGVPFGKELKRVMVHGLLHCMEYNDKSQGDRRKMREKEDEKIKMFHVEH